MSYPQHQGPPTVIYVTTAPVAAAPIQVNSKWRNKPQSNATAAGGLIFLSGGMNMALSAGWAVNSIYGLQKHFYYSWFIAVIIGTILSAPLRTVISKKLIMGASTLLILIGGILFTSDPYNYDALLAGRYINGIAIGLAIVPFLMHASEVSDDSYRGACLSIEQYSMSFGIAIQMIYSSYWTAADMPANRLHGILDIVYAVMAGASLKYFIESPVELVRKGDEVAALNCLARLRRPQGVTTETQALLEQQKAYVREEENLTVGQSIGRGFLPLVKLLIVRSMMLTFCFSMPLSVALLGSMLITGSRWTATVAGVLRMLGSLVAVCMVDNTGRKLPAIFSVVLIGGLLIGIGSSFHSVISAGNATYMSTAMYMCLVVQLFAGFFAPYTSVFMGEAFPLRVKPYLMTVVVIVEQILQIIFIETISVSIGSCLMAQGVIAVVVFLFMCISMPETRNTSLTEAQRRFRNLLNLRLN